MRFLRLLRAAPLFLAPVVVVACSSKSDSAQPVDSGVGGDTNDAGTVAFTARWEIPETGAPDFLQVPFPSDLHLAANGTIVLEPGAADDVRGLSRILPRTNGAKYMRDALAHTVGFGPYAGALFEIVGGSVDASKLPTGQKGDCTTKDSPVFFFDLDAGQALECIAGYNDDSVFGEKAGDDGPLAKVLTVRTARGVVVPEGHKVVAILTSGVVDAKGAPLAASDKFVAVRDWPNQTGGKAPYRAAIDAVIAKLGIDKTRIVAAATYTVGHVTDELRAARELARATAVPTLKWGKDDVAPVTPARFTATSPLPTGWNATLDDYFGTPNKLASGKDDPDWGGTNPGIAHDAIGAFGVAAFDAPNFLLDKGGDYGDPEHATFFHAADGKVAINPAKPTAKIWVTLVVPKGTMPTAGWPVVVFQHGMAGQRGDALAIANTLASHGWAMAAIEVVGHGTRGFDGVARGDKKSDYKRSTAKYTGPDGFSDRSADGSNSPPNALFGELYRIAAMRDQFRQSALDHTTLLRLLKSSPKLDGLADGGVTPMIDGSKVAYIGDSLGGIVGSITAGIEPDHAAYILDVPGGGIFIDLATNSPNIYGLLRGAGSLFFGYQHTQLPPWHPMVHLIQHVFDGGDPTVVAQTAMHPVPIAGATPKARNILMLEVLADELVANPATEGLARSIGASLITPHHTPLFATLAEADGAAGVHDVPVAGSTAALIHVFPAQHGGEMLDKTGTRSFAWPTAKFGDPSQEPFPKLATDAKFDQPYLELQDAVMKFIGDAFDGKVPTVTWTKAPGNP